MCLSMSAMTMLLPEQKSLPKCVSREDGGPRIERGADLSGQGQRRGGQVHRPSVVVQELKRDQKGQ